MRERGGVEEDKEEEERRAERVIFRWVRRVGGGYEGEMTVERSRRVAGGGPVEA